MLEILNIILIAYLGSSSLNQNLNINYGNFKNIIDFSYTLDKNTNEQCLEKEINSSIIYSNVKSNKDCNLIRKYNNLIKNIKEDNNEDLIQKNEELFIQLFEKNLIPSYKIFSSDNKDIYIGLGNVMDRLKPELLNNNNLICKTFYGDTYTNLCFIYIKNSDNKSIKIWKNTYDNESAYFKKIDNDNLEYVDRSGAIGGYVSKYKSYKIEKNNIVEINSFKEEGRLSEEYYNKVNDNPGIIENYSKGNLSLIIYSDFNKNIFKYGIFTKINDLQETINFGNDSKKDYLFKNTEIGNTWKIVITKDKLFTKFNGKFEIDEKTNLMNGDEFEFLIDGKKFKYDTKNLKRIDN